MRSGICLLIFCFAFIFMHYKKSSAQNVGISPTGVPPDNSAGLDVDFTNKGVLVPRVALTSSTDASTIPSPATSLLVFNTGLGGLTPAGYYYNAGTPASPIWAWFSSPGIAWQMIYLDTWDQLQTTDLGWTGASVTDCAGQYMLGGYNQCASGCTLSKTFTNLPPHNQVMVKVHYWKIDSHGQADTDFDRIAILLDGTTIVYALGDINYGFGYLQRHTDRSLCGMWPSQESGPFSVLARRNHTGSTLQVQIQSLLNELPDNESIGIVAVEVWVN